MSAIMEIRRINNVGMMYVPKRFRKEIGIDGGDVVIEIEERDGRKVMVLRPVRK